MPNAWVPGFALTLLSSLQPVSANETLFNCSVTKCPKEFICCDKGCCLESKIWNPSNDPFSIFFLVSVVMIPLLCICGLVRLLCPKHREPEQNLRVNHQIPPEPPSVASLEMIWVTTLDPPPPYSQVVQKPTPTEPPPPYSLRPEDPADEMRGINNPAF
ncbi:transmembrane protein 92 [Sigmodon hispidus]